MGMAQSGLMQLLKTFGVDIDPAEIQKQAFQFRDLLASLDRRLADISAQQAVIMRHLGVENGRSEQPNGHAIIGQHGKSTDAIDG